MGPKQYVLKLSDILDPMGKETRLSYIMLKCDEHTPTIEYWKMYAKLYSNVNIHQFSW